MQSRVQRLPARRKKTRSKGDFVGDPRKLKKKFETPNMLWDATRLKEEQLLLEEYGLRNMRELWIMKQELKKIRREARRLLSKGDAGKAASSPLLAKVVRLGYAKPETGLEDLLALKPQDVLERRLETRVVKKGLAKTMVQSRQLIVHGFIAINGRKISSPGYIVPVNEENSIAYYKNFDLNAGEEAQAKEAKHAHAKAEHEKHSAPAPEKKEEPAGVKPEAPAPQ